MRVQGEGGVLTGKNLNFSFFLEKKEKINFDKFKKYFENFEKYFEKFEKYFEKFEKYFENFYFFLGGGLSGYHSSNLQTPQQ